MSALTANVAVAAAIVLFGVSMLLLAIGVLTYTRMRSGRLFWVCVAFLVMAGQGLYLSILAYQNRAAIATGDWSLTGLTAVNLGIVFALYLAVLKR